MAGNPCVDCLTGGPFLPAGGLDLDPVSEPVDTDRQTEAIYCPCGWSCHQRESDHPCSLGCVEHDPRILQAEVDRLRAERDAAIDTLRHVVAECYCDADVDDRQARCYIAFADRPDLWCYWCAPFVRLASLVSGDTP